MRIFLPLAFHLVGQELHAIDNGTPSRPTQQDREVAPWLHDVLIADERIIPMWFDPDRAVALLGVNRLQHFP